MPPATRSGVGIVEVVVAVSVLAVVFGVLFNVAVLAIALADDAVKKTQAANLLEEGMEGVRIFRDATGANFTSQFANAYAAQTRCIAIGALVSFPVAGDASCTIGTFTRQATFTKISDNEVKTTITVQWESRRGTTQSEDLIFHLTNFKNI